jgi:hypothetical protein
MSGTTYALLAGIDTYSADLPPLSGCVNDVRGFRAYLEDRFGKAGLALEVLENGDATRDNIVRGFREHLGRAQGDDAALFMYCGYGALSPAAPAFRASSFGGYDEGLVLFDSRDHGRPDLVDKELAALLHEVSRNNPHVAVILDCCHTGSEPEARDERARFTRPGDGRALDDYLEGFYRGEAKEGVVAIPTSKHIVMAACNRSQTARERGDEGLFSQALLDVLGGPDPLTYAELFTRCRLAIGGLVKDQDPEFECFGRFNVDQGFLGTLVNRDTRATVYVENDQWTMDRGAFNGLPSDPANEIRVEIYGDGEYVGSGRATEVLPGKSRLRISSHQGSVLTPDPDTTYHAVVASLPCPPLAVYAEEPGQTFKLLRRKNRALGNVRPPIPGVELVADPRDYRLSVDHTGELKTFVMELPRSSPPLLVHGPPGDAEGIDKREYMVGVLEAAARFERLLSLQNHHRRLSTSVLDLCLRVRPGEPDEYRDDDGDISVDFARPSDAEAGWIAVPYTLQATNRHDEPLYVAVSFLTERLGIVSIQDPQRAPSGVWTLAPGETVELDASSFTLPDELESTENHLLVLVSTDEIPSLALTEQEDVPERFEGSRGVGSERGSSKKTSMGSDWFTKRIRVRMTGHGP